MKSLISILFVLFSVGILHTQVEEIYGSWSYLDLQSDSVDDKTLDVTRAFFKEMKFDFSEDQKYVSELLGKKEFGSFEITENQTLLLTSEANVTQEYDLIECNNDQLKLGYKDVYLVFSKGTIEEEVEEVEMYLEPAGIQLDKSQVSGKWKIQAVYTDSQKVEMTDNEYLLHFFEKEKYRMVYDGQESRGDWNFNSDNSVIYLNTTAGLKTCVITDSADKMLELEILEDQLFYLLIKSE